MLLVPLYGMGSWLSSKVFIFFRVSLLYNVKTQQIECLTLMGTQMVEKWSSSMKIIRVTVVNATTKIVKMNNEWKTLLFITKY